MAPRGLRNTRSQAVEGEASSNHEATSPSQMQRQQVSATPVLQSTPSAQPQIDVIAQLSPILLDIQQALQALVHSQRTPTAVPTPAVP